MDKVKLTKTALSKFITWSTSKYNDWCGYGTKKENVELVYRSLSNGCFVNHRGILENDKKVFEIQCAGGVGENGNGRYWKTKQSGDRYEVDCVNKTVKAVYSKREISFQ